MRNAFLTLILITLLTSVGQAKLLLEAGAGYFSDAITTSTSDTSTKLVYNVGVLFSINKGFWGGWSYAGLSYDKMAASTTTQLIGYGTGPYLKYQFGRGRSYSISMAYNILNTATYTGGSSSETWSGTSYNLQFAAMPELREGLNVGVTFNYYSATYSKRVIGSTESNISYTRAWIYPTISMTKAF
jgi:hypothetical protein